MVGDSERPFAQFPLISAQTLSRRVSSDRFPFQNLNHSHYRHS